MDYIDECLHGNVGLKIKSTPSMAKTISIIRKYNPISMSEIKNQVETGEYVLAYPYTSTPGLRTIRRCYDELIKAGNEVEIYEHDRLSSRELISNLIASNRQIEREVQAQIDAEAAAEEALETGTTKPKKAIKDF